MAQPIQEPSDQRELEGHAFRSRQLFRRPPVSAGGQFDIKITSDADAPVAGDGAFIFAIPADLNGGRLVRAEGYVTTVGSADTVVQISNLNNAVDMLTDPVTVDAGDFTSYASASPSVVDEPNAGVSTGDRISVDIVADGGGALGLGVILDFV